MPICDARELACLRPAIVLSTNRLLPRQHRHVFSFYRFSPFSRICFCVVQRLCHCLPLLSSPTTFPSCCPLLHPPPVHSYRAVLLPRCVVLPRWHSNVMPAPKAAVCYYTVRNTHTHTRAVLLVAALLVTTITPYHHHHLLCSVAFQVFSTTHFGTRADATHVVASVVAAVLRCFLFFLY
jgi:hypothetical protein